MLSLRLLSIISPDITTLYQTAFPPEERRNLPAQQELLQSGALQLAQIEKAGVFAGFIFYWPLTDFIFIEHFAIAETQRGSGIGSAVMQLLSDQYNHIVLEVEPPHSPDAIRRIRFYESLGFTAWPWHYLQPPYQAGHPPLHMLLMQKGMSPEEHTFHIVSHEIYREVYGN